MKKAMLLGYPKSHKTSENAQAWSEWTSGSQQCSGRQQLQGEQGVQMRPLTAAVKPQTSMPLEFKRL